MNNSKTFIYLVPGNYTSGYRICTEKFIIDELTALGHNVYPIKRFHARRARKTLNSHPVNALIFSSLDIIWKNQNILTLAKELGVETYWWYFDTAMSKSKRTEKVNKIAPQVDVFFNKDSEEFHRYRELRANPIWLDQGVADICKYHEARKSEYDLVFIGSLNKVHENRLKILKQLNRKYSLTIFAPRRKEYLSQGLRNVRGPVTQSEIGAIAAKTRITISLSSSPHRPYCWSDRIHLLLGSGAFCISEYVEGIEESYTDGKDCLFFHNLDELFQLIDYWIADDLESKREEIRYQGFLTAHEKHSYRNRVIEFLRLVRP